MGILPLSALIEFIDVATKLHVFELNGSVPLWSWPVTPAGARLLLSTEDTSNACCLDRPTRSVDLHCIDGRYGNCYPSCISTTLRLYMSAQKPDITVENTSSNMADKGLRKQSLDVFIVCDQDPVPSKWSHLRLSRTLNTVLSGKCPKYWLLSGVGWLSLIGITVISLLAGLYIASVFLIHPWARLVLVNSSFNGSEWSAFYGRSSTLNALLNKPLFRPSVNSRAFARTSR